MASRYNRWATCIGNIRDANVYQRLGLTYSGVNFVASFTISTDRIDSTEVREVGREVDSKRGEHEVYLPRIWLPAIDRRWRVAGGEWRSFVPPSHGWTRPSELLLLSASRRATLAHFSTFSVGGFSVATRQARYDNTKSGAMSAHCNIETHMRPINWRPCDFYVNLTKFKAAE